MQNINKTHFKTTKIFMSLLACGLAFNASTLFASESPLAEEETSKGLEVITVTSQKRAENLQEVPIAVSAFSQDDMQKQGLLGGPDLKLSVPNVSFGETGFGRYNFQIRGIGGLIQGASADVGVGIHLNNIPLTESRIVQSEFYDVERVEVLRGPQGTLYGRNATGGVVNIITEKPQLDFSASLTGEFANYNTRRLRGHVNVPVAENFAVRLAGTMIKRDGNIDNVGTGNEVNSRDIASSRLSALWQPTESLSVTAIWEHFTQDDTSGANAKIICAPDPGPTSIGGVATNPLTQAFLAKGCLNTDVQSKQNNGVSNSLTTLSGIFGLLAGTAPYNTFAGKVLSTDLHTIESPFDPSHEADNNTYSIEIAYDINEELTFTSLSSYSKDEFLTQSIIAGGIPTLGFLDSSDPANGIFPLLTPGGIFNSPQLGALDRPTAKYYFDKRSEQYTQEFRLQSNYDDDINFSIGGIYMDFESDVDNIVLDSTVNQIAVLQNLGGAGIYIDTNETPDGTGHNYFNNKPPYKLNASALFGELYYNVNTDVKATVGLRYTKDEKEQITNPVLMLAPGRGFPEIDPQEVTFEEFTGRLTVDWKVDENSMVYASYSRGYKGGGFNPGGAGGDTVDPSFKPEFVDAIEFGSKNLLLDSTLALNTSLFYYDYQDYQISKVVNQTVATENVDARVTGLELELIYEPIDDLRFNAQLGLLKSKIVNGESIDILDRTQGDDALSIVRSTDPANGFATSCVMPTAFLAGLQGAINAGNAPAIAMGFQCGDPLASEGVAANIDGNELPMAPDFTLSFGAEYVMELGKEWVGTLRGDYYVQGDSYARIYNTEVDRLHRYDNLNVSYRFESMDNGIEVLLYARNLLSEDVITNMTIQSDETGGGRLIRGKERPSFGLTFTKRWDD